MGSMATEMTGSGKVICSRMTGLPRVAHGVADPAVLDGHGGGDVAGVDLLDLLALVGVHAQDAADALGVAVVAEHHGVADLKGAGVDAEEGQLADEGVGLDLEHQRRERVLVVGLALHGLPRSKMSCPWWAAGPAGKAGSRRRRRAWAGRPCSCRRRRTARGRSWTAARPCAKSLRARPR